MKLVEINIQIKLNIEHTQTHGFDFGTLIFFLVKEDS